MRTLFGFLLCAVFALFYIGCKKPFEPPIIAANPGYLVVEGFINSGADTTLFKLSHTVKLNSTTKTSPERGARLTVESDKNDKYPLREISRGIYIAIGLNLPADRNYRLHIFTAAGKEYVSDYVENKITPPVDSVSYKPLQTGIEFYVSSHDNTNKTRYYRWNYDETWSYFAPLVTQLLYKNGQVSFRTMDSIGIYTCYKHAVPSNSVFIGTTDKLANDVVNDNLLGYTDASTGKLTQVYSLLVKQYALTSEAYKYWQLLKTNTEELGSIFDAQPSSAITNIHAVADPTEPVIGYISTSTVTTKRIFVQGRLLPPFVLGKTHVLPDSVECKVGTILLAPAQTLEDRLRQILASGDSLLTTADTDPHTGQINKYFYAPSVCVDCRLDGGTNIKPPYWPY